MDKPKKKMNINTAGCSEDCNISINDSKVFGSRNKKKKKKNNTGKMSKRLNDSIEINSLGNTVNIDDNVNRKKDNAENPSISEDNGRINTLLKKNTKQKKKKKKIAVVDSQKNNNIKNNEGNNDANSSHTQSQENNLEQKKRKKKKKKKKKSCQSSS